jgi:glycolate oxidase subunit GlcD
MENTAPHPATQTSIDALRKEIGQDHVLTDQATRDTYGRDWTKHYDINAGGVAFPESPDEVVKIVKWARANNVALVPSGGRTGLSGGACATKGELVVSFEKMNKVLELNKVDRTVRVQPGLVTEALQQYAEEQGFYYPVDFAAVGSSQIGGNIATNAGGIKVLRYGLTRDWIAGLKVVTGAGDLLEVGGDLIKNATGLDLRHLFIGSEGTLGFVVEATIKLALPPKPLSVLMLAVPDLDSIMKVFAEFRSTVPLTAFEYFSDIALKTVKEHTHLSSPLTSASPHYLVIEVENLDLSVQEQMLSTFEKCVEEGWATDGAIAQSDAQARDFWRLREDISEATASYQPYKNDVSVTISKVPEFLKEVDGILKAQYPDFEVVWFGHIGDGNMHINILKPANLTREKFLERCLKVNDLLFTVIHKLGGSISAEHGVGLVKKPFLTFSRSPEEISIMKGIKKVLDPDGIMNPGKVFD